MKFSWDSSTIKRYQDANEYTGFFKNVADLIAPKLKGYSTFCDIGCGLGLIDIELSSCIQNITCIDISENAINFLNEKIKNKEITNIKTRLMNCHEIDETWDVIYISFFGYKSIEKFLPYCKQLFAVVNINETESTLKKYMKFNKGTCKEVEQELKYEGIEYQLTEVSLEFGTTFNINRRCKELYKKFYT